MNCPSLPLFFFSQSLPSGINNSIPGARDADLFHSVAAADAVLLRAEHRWLTVLSCTGECLLYQRPKLDYDVRLSVATSAVERDVRPDVIPV